MFGKYLNAMPGNTWNVSKPDGYVPAGWSCWFANGGSYIASGFATSGLKEAAGIDDGAIQLDNSPATTSTSAIGNVSMAWIRHTVKTGKGPFFAYIAPKAAHEPFDPAPWQWTCVGPVVAVARASAGQLELHRRAASWPTRAWWRRSRCSPKRRRTLRTASSATAGARSCRSTT